jgi:Trk-type K+ transport system membrane component
VIGLAIEPGMMLSALNWIGGVTIAVTAWIRLASLEISEPAQAAADDPATTVR